MTKNEAIALGKTEWWKDKEPYEICLFQLFERLLCMPFEEYHKATEKALGRPVWSHEFADVESLRKEFLGEREPPTIEEIFSVIPEHKRIILGNRGGLR